MPNRIIREGINTSARINSLSVGAENFYRRLMTVVDDYGRYYGAPETLRVAVCPTMPERFRIDDVKSWLAELTAGMRPLVREYKIDGASYIEFDAFGQRIQAKSKFPDPPNITAKPSGAPQTGENGIPPCSTVENGGPPKTTVEHGKKSVLVGDEVGDGVAFGDRARGARQARVASEMPETPSPSPSKTRKKPPGRTETDGSMADAVGVMLRDLATVLHFPDPDEEIIRRTIEATTGASAEDVFGCIRGLYQQGKFSSMRSWAYLPVVIAPWFRERQTG